MILIVAFNARSIARLARKVELPIAIVDFWADQDIFPLAKKIYTIFKPEHKSYAAFPNPSENEDRLVDLALKIITKEDIDSVIIGSGLDDRPDLWEKLRAVVPIQGNTPDCLREVRDILRVQGVLDREKIRFPATIQSKNWSKICDFATKVGFPLVIKPLKTLGGYNIHLIRNRAELENFYQKTSEINKYYFQEFIEGIPISTTMVGCAEKFILLSINEQLIGLKSSGTKLPFKYCGNIIPFDCGPNLAQKIEADSFTISKAFQLSGVFGIDFVLRDGIPYFIEINPRFPGTIEILEMISKINAVQLHLDASKGNLPDNINKPEGYAIKQVFFAESVMISPNFQQKNHLYDIPYPGILLNPEDPICTVQFSDPDRNNLLKKMEIIRKDIYSES